MRWSCCLFVVLVGLGVMAPQLVAQETPSVDPSVTKPESTQSVEQADPPLPDDSGTSPAGDTDEPSPPEPAAEAEAPEAATDQNEKPADQQPADQEPPSAESEPQPDGNSTDKPGKSAEKPDNPDSKGPGQKDQDADESGKSNQPSDSSDDASDDKAPQAEKPADADQPAETEESAERQLELDPETAKVLQKPYPQNVGDLKRIQQQTQRVVKYATPATISVRVGQAFGSAVIVSPDGLVLTAGHVVGRPGLPVTFIFSDGTTAKGKTLGMYREIDSGMMKITDPGPWPYVKMAKAKDIKTGQWVVAIGHPGGFDPQRTPPVRLGRVLFANDELISTDCTLVGGDSGGPLYNMRGEVVGIHSRIGRRITDNFHVPISTYHATFDRLAAGESWGRGLGNSRQTEARPLLGVTGNPYDPECRLAEVFPNLPAARAGLKSGDVVRKFNGKQVDSFQDLVKLVFNSKPGDKVSVEVDRGDETLEMEIRLGVASKPIPGSADNPADDDPESAEKNEGK